jgi:hypothetical protein
MAAAKGSANRSSARKSEHARTLAHAGRIVHRVKTTQAREEFGTMINTVAYGGHWIVFERRDRDLAALIPMSDLARLQALAASEATRAGWDGIQDPASYDWRAAESVRRQLDRDYMH